MVMGDSLTELVLEQTRLLHRRFQPPIPAVWLKQGGFNNHPSHVQMVY